MKCIIGLHKFEYIVELVSKTRVMTKLNICREKRKRERERARNRINLPTLYEYLNIVRNSLIDCLASFGFKFWIKMTTMTPVENWESIVCEMNVDRGRTINSFRVRQASLFS